MTPAEQVPDDLLIARTAVEKYEETTDALLRAAERAHIDLDDVEPALYDQIEAGALDILTAHHRSRNLDSDFVVVTELRGRTFVITPDSVEA